MSKHVFPNHEVNITDVGRVVSGDGFRLLFLSESGLTIKTTENGGDPSWCPWGNEIADIEITTSCRGIRGVDGRRKPCEWCYKNSSSNGLHMSLDTFKEVFSRLNANLTMTQIAFGVDAECTANPDTEAIFQHCRDNGVVPNVTVADISDETAEMLVRLCGAVAVSCYPHNKGACYESIDRLTRAREAVRSNLTINMHLLVSEETHDFVNEVLNDIANKGLSELRGLRAVVLLSLKQKGRGTGFTPISEDRFQGVIHRCFQHEIPFGMDSCSANAFLRAIENHPDRDRLTSQVEPCEALLFSAYVNVRGELFPCSFVEGEAGWKTGVKITDHDSFEEIWTRDPRVLAWREMCLRNIEEHGCNHCPVFQITQSQGDIE